VGRDGAGNRTSLVDAKGQTTAYTYDAANQLTGINYSDGTTPAVSDTYDADGQRIRMTDGTGTTTYVFDSLHRLTSSTDGAGHSVGYGYDLAGQLTSLTYPNGQTVTRAYDPAGHLAAVGDWLGNTTQFGYDANSNLTSQADANGVSATSEFDNADRLLSLTDQRAGATLASFSYARDNLGQVAAANSSGAGDSPHAYSYTALNQLRSDNGAPYSYDHADNPTGLTNGASQTFDVANELLTSTASSPAPGSGPSYTPLVPARILDTRAGQTTIDNQFAGGGPVGPDSEIDLTVVSRGGVPSSGVSAVVVNITATEPTDPTFVTVWPAGEPRPLASNLNVAASQTVPNLVTAKVGTNGQIAIYNLAGSVHLIADVVGWFPANSGFTPLVPARLLDTRPGQATIDHAAAGAGPVGPNDQLDLDVVGRGGVPATGVSAVVLNVTATEPSEPTFVTVWPHGEPRPLASNLNVVAGQTVPNLVVAKVGTDGKVSLYNLSGTVHLVADVVGWFADSAGFTPLVPARVLDTRPGQATIDNQFAGAGAVGPDSERGLTVLGRGGVPSSGVSAVVLNVTATEPTNPTFVTVWPHGEARPLASNLNVVAGQTVPNLVIAKVGTNGQVAFYNFAGDVHLVADVVGWFASSTSASASDTSEAGDTTYSYDANGNRVTVTPPGGVTTSLTYDQANRLVAYGPTATYTYNGDGLRATKTVNGGLTSFAWDIGEGLPLLLTDGAENYVYGPSGVPIEEIGPAPQGTIFLHNDQLGSTRLLTNAAGAVVATYTYDPYGHLATHTGTASTPFGYAGQYTDPESGLQYLRARYYDPTTAQFLNVDPLKTMTATPYGYAGDNPVNALDSTGTVFTTDGGGAPGGTGPSPDQWLQAELSYPIFACQHGAPGFPCIQLETQLTSMSALLQAAYASIINTPCLPVSELAQLQSDYAYVSDTYNQNLPRLHDECLSWGTSCTFGGVTVSGPGTVPPWDCVTGAAGGAYVSGATGDLSPLGLLQGAFQGCMGSLGEPDSPPISPPGT
jgi:RHS repeat-associated protein